MSQTTVVSIGGIDYDSATGESLGASTVAHVEAELRRAQSIHASGVHQKQQRSSSLNRQFVKKPASVEKEQASVVQPIRRGGSMDMRRVQRSPHISKFAKNPVAIASQKAVDPQQDVPATTHPVVAKVHAKQIASTPVSNPQIEKSAPSARDIKHAALGKALAEAAPSTHKQIKTSSKRGSVLSVAAASLGVLLVAGYFTYINMPNLSVRVAAAQAGINASYPEYHPIGYRLNGPVAYQNGEVSMNFASNSSPVAFSLNQSKSSWDSSALLEKYVSPKSNGNYATYTDAGLTIYTFGNDAAWVNNGLLYTVDGTANLSNEQIRRMATSM